MKKVKFLARKLKAFSFNDIFSLAELPKEELQEKLDKLVEENILKKTTQGYIYCEFDYVPPPTAPTVKGEAVTFVRDDDYVKFSENDYGKMKSLSLAELGNIPEYNRKKYTKFFGLLKLTRGLYGKQLVEFIKEYNKQNPDDKTSYANIVRKRNLYVKYGPEALVAKFGKPRKLYYPDMEKYYMVFKKYYFSPKKLNIEACRQLTAKELHIPLEQFPHRITFRRRLLKDYTTIEMKNKRNFLCF